MLGAVTSGFEHVEHDQGGDDDADYERAPDDLAVVETGDLYVSGEDVEKAAVLDGHGAVVKNDTANAAEDEHAAESGYEGGNADVAYPVALPDADQQTDYKAYNYGEIGVHADVGNKHGCDAAYHAYYGADGQVYVAAGEYAQQHAACHDQNVAVLKHEVRHVRRIEQPAVGQNCKQCENHHKGDDHCILGYETYKTSVETAVFHCGPFSGAFVRSLIHWCTLSFLSPVSRII